MGLNIIEQKDNILLDRKEVIFSMNSKDKTPKRDEMKEKLVLEFGHNKDLIVIENILTRFGSKEITVYASLYNSEDSLKKYSKKYILKRNSLIKKEDKKEG